jgi:hypothetical protein
MPFNEKQKSLKSYCSDCGRLFEGASYHCRRCSGTNCRPLPEGLDRSMKTNETDKRNPVLVV